MEGTACLKCGGTGLKSDGESCDCVRGKEVRLPTVLRVPEQYQDVQFDRSFLKGSLQGEYGRYMKKLIEEIEESAGRIKRNLLICAPPNSGKTVFAYTVVGLLYAKGVEIVELLDVIEVRRTLLECYSKDDSKLLQLSNSAILMVKIPMDIPNKLAATMSTIVERRVRNNGATVFLYSGSKDDLIAQDTFGKLKSIEGDGSYNSIKIESF